MAHSRTPKDTFNRSELSIEGPARFALNIDPAEATLDVSTRSLYVGIGGNVYCRPMGYANNVTGADEGGNHANVFFYNVVSGTILPVRMDAVWVRNHGDISQNTTASQLVGLW
jgi:hypothetical protein